MILGQLRMGARQAKNAPLHENNACIWQLSILFATFDFDDIPMLLTHKYFQIILIRLEFDII